MMEALLTMIMDQADAGVHTPEMAARMILFVGANEDAIAPILAQRLDLYFVTLMIRSACGPSL